MSRERNCLPKGKRAAWWLWIGCLVGAALIHVGTAGLRLNSFFPVPQAVDFSSYYAGAWSIRLGLSPYAWSDELLKFLAETQGLATVPPSHNSSPLWAWLLQPLTLLRFPASATLWLGLLLLLSGYCHILLLRLAGYDTWKPMLLALPITLTFGPLFLNLTLGQNGAFLLLSALLMGAALKKGASAQAAEFVALTSWVVAVGAKIYPVLWIGALLLLLRWRMLATALMLCLATVGLLAVLEPQLNADYWLTFLPKQTQLFATGVGIDDQSLNALLSRVGTSQRYTVPGLDPQVGHTVVWTLPWDFSPQAIRYITLILLLILGAWLGLAWIKNRAQDPDGSFYAGVLFILLLFPHIERYNHILALPAMAWLWGRQKTVYRNLTILAYGLFGLSRLNHGWALLPTPIGPLASGFGLYGVLILSLGLAHALIYHYDKGSEVMVQGLGQAQQQALNGPEQ